MGLRNVRIKVPTAVVRGHDAVLQCLFDLEGEKLYSVKWYRGIAEFFRYSPSEFPPIKQFRIRGLNIRERDSRDTQVVLEKVSKDIGGLFTCEITADRNFHTAVQTAELKVVELPKKDPYITGLKTRYKLEDALKANCTSEGSDPAANLTWYVNGVPVEEKYVRHHKPAAYKDEKLVSAKSTVRLRVTTDLFNNGKLKLRCSATMYHLYHRSSEKSIELQRKRHRSPYVWLETPTTIEPPFEQWEMPAERPPQATVEFYAPASRSFGGPLLQANFATTYTTLFVVIHQIR
ncbi:cell adhesion molecule 3-like isoform X2 [Cylas formicarius]|nr:cell adhesion molecule 3-like isoform X2 [Cylas formicarius]